MRIKEMINLEFPLSNNNILVSVFDLDSKIVYSKRGQGIANITPGAYSVSFTMGKYSTLKELDLSEWEGSLCYSQTKSLEEELYSKNSFLLDNFSNEIGDQCCLRLMYEIQNHQDFSSKKIALELISVDKEEFVFDLNESQAIDLKIKPGDYKLSIKDENSYYPLRIKADEVRVIYIDLDSIDFSYEYHQTICKSKSSIQIEDILESIEITYASQVLKKFSHEKYLDALSNDYNLLRFILSLVWYHNSSLQEDSVWEKLSSISEVVKESADYQIFLFWTSQVAGVRKKSLTLDKVHPIGFEFSTSWHYLREISLFSPNSIGLEVYKRRYFDFGANIKVSKGFKQSDLSRINSLEDVENNIQTLLSNLFIINNSANFNNLIFGHATDLADLIISYLLNLPLSIFIDILNELFYDKQRDIVSPLASKILGFEESEIIDFNYEVVRLKPDTDWKADFGFFTNLELIQAIGKPYLKEAMSLFWKYFKDDTKVESLVRNFNVSLFELNHEIVLLNDRVKTRAELNISAAALQKTYLPKTTEIAKTNLDLLFEPI